MNPIALVFAIIVVVVLTVAGVVLGLSLLGGGSSSAVAQDVMTVASDAQSVYGVQGNYTGISSTSIPKQLQGGTPVGGTFGLAAGAVTSQFVVSMNGLSVSPRTCEKIITQINDISTSVNGKAVGNANGAPTGAQATTACGGGASSLAFTFGNNG